MSLSSLREERQKKMSERDALLRRKEAVDRIVLSIDTGLDYEIAGVNTTLYMSASQLGDGIKGSSHVGEIMEDMLSETERNTLEDSCMESCHWNLSEEAARCQRKIDELNEEIQKLEQRIVQEEEAQRRVAEEARRAAEEAKRQAEEAARKEEQKREQQQTKASRGRRR